MKILAVDTAAQSYGVAIMKDGLLLAEITAMRDRSHSGRLMEMIEAACHITGLSASDMDGFGVTQGPGSFTGLRIAVSTVKGLALASGKPLAGVSALDALAIQFSHVQMQICTLIDARKGEVYCCRYRNEKGVQEKMTPEQALSPLMALAEIAEPCLFVGSGALLYRQVICDTLGNLAVFPPVEGHIIRPGVVGRMAAERIAKNEIDSLSAFAPIYIRSSDAELHLGKSTR